MQTSHVVPGQLFQSCYITLTICSMVVLCIIGIGVLPIIRRSVLSLSVQMFYPKCATKNFTASQNALVSKFFSPKQSLVLDIPYCCTLLYYIYAYPYSCFYYVDMASQSTQQPATNPVPQELTDSHLRLLLETLNPVASKCHNLGVHLGLSSSQLHAIEHNYRKCEDQLREIISERLRQESPLTWHGIFRALRAVSENRLASEIKNKYIHNLPPPASVAPQANTVSLATSSLTSSLQSSLPASQCDTSASSSVNQYYQMEINVPQPPSSVPQQERAGSSTYTSAHHSTHVLPSSQHSLHTLRTDPAQTHTSPSHAAHPPLTNQFLPHPLRQPHMPIPHPAFQPLMRPPQYLPHYPPQLNPTLALDGIHPPAQPQSVQPFASDRPSQLGTPSPSYMYPHHHMPLHLHQAPYPTSTYAPYHTIPHMSLPATNRYSLQVEADGTGWSSPLLNPHNDPLLPHTMQTHRPSGSSSLESGCPPAKRPYLETTLEPYSQSHTQSSSCGSGSIEHVSPMTMYKGKSRHTGEWSVSDTYLHQSGRQAPGREHYQSQQGPTTAGLHTTHKQSHNSSSGSRSTEVKSPMDLFIEYVKDTYRQSAIEKNPNVVKWPPTPSKVYISLACIDRSTALTEAEVDGYTRAMVEDGNIDVILQKKDCTIDFDDVARGLPQTDSSQNVIVVEGAPGVGKSTFAWEFCRKWVRGEIAQQYQLVLLLRLRDDRISKARSLEDLIYHPRPDICQGVLHELLGNGGINTLIILEGFDELPDDQRKLSSIFGQLILGNVLLHATILVTSRHWATSAVMRKIGHRVFQHIEVLGFTEESIERYVTSVFTGKEVGAHSVEESPDEVSEKAKKNIDDVMKYLDTYPQIKACMYIPLNAAIVVSIYQESKKRNYILPKTLTELYCALTRNLLLRYLDGHEEYGKKEWYIDSFENDLPGEVYTQLLSISKIAYDGISRKWGKSVQLIFSDLPAGFETLGFMQSVSQLYVKHGQRMSHNFLHLTVQEFLAALYIQTTMTPAEQLEHFKRHKEGRVKVVLKFLAGLTKLNIVTHEQLRGLLGEPHTEPSDECQSHYCNPMKADVCVSAHHTNWLFEAQNPDLVQSLLHNHTAAFTFSRDMLLLEYYSVGYCIAYSHSKWLLIFEDDADVEKLSMIVSGVQAGNIHHSTRLALKTSKRMSNAKLNFLWNGFSSCIEELYLKVPESLDLSNLSALRILVLTMGGISSISDLSVHCLESLTIIGTAKNAVSIATGKCIHEQLSASSSLKELCFKNSVRETLVEKIIKDLSDKKARPLKRLEIHGSKYYDTFSTALRCLGKFTTLQYLRMCNVKISGQGLIALIPAIHNCSSLQEKKIVGLTLVFDDEWSDVSTEEVRASLTQLINDHPHMMDVEESLRDLSANEENYIKASVIALCCDYCFEIYLNNKSISDAGAVALAQALHHNSTWRRLNLSNNSISDAGAVALAQALHHNSTWRRLDLSYNDGIGEEGTHQLVQALTVNTSISSTPRGGICVRLPERCEEYATQCTQYDTVKNRMLFL